MRVKRLIIFALFIAGCSNQAAYENIQMNKRNACLALPPSQYDQCMAEASTSFDDYEHTRKEATSE